MRPMSLDQYFKNLIDQVENTEEISNAGKDKDGFYKPTRTILLRHLQLLKDLHAKPRAKAMLQASWVYVVEHVPAEWLVPSIEEDKDELRRILE